MARALALAALAAAVAAHVDFREGCHDLKSCSKALAAAEALLPALKPLRQHLVRQPGGLRHAMQSLAGALSGTDSTYCSNNSYFQFFPAPVANIQVSAPSTSWPGDGCFANMAATATFEPSGASVTLTGSSASSFLCSDSYLVTSSFSIQLVTVGGLAPSASANLSWTGADEIADVNVNGLQIMVLPCGLLGTVSSVLKTVGLFSGNASQLASSNIDFLLERNVWPSPPELFNATIDVDTSAIRSGDYLAITRFDGLDPMIAFGTGGITGHSALAVWETDPATGQRTLYVCESTDKNPLGPVYFPPPYGIIRHPFSQWVGYAQQAAFHVSLLPLAESYSSAFNETAYWNWFYTVQGMPYGYHTMLMSFLDTYAPFANLPAPIGGQELAVVLNALDGVLGNATSGVTVDSMFTQPLNKRLNTTCTSLRCIINVLNVNKAAGRSPSSFVEAVAIPEQDGAKYGANLSMVCSEFAAHGWKTGLGAASPVWAQIEAAEQTPRDNYQMALFDTTGARFTAAQCPGGVTTSPSGPGAYCQIMGLWRMYLNGYNSIPLYAGMNNRCPAQWPTYTRCPTNNPQCC